MTFLRTKATIWKENANVGSEIWVFNPSWIGNLKKKNNTFQKKKSEICKTTLKKKSGVTGI